MKGCEDFNSHSVLVPVVCLWLKVQHQFLRFDDDDYELKDMLDM